MHVNEYMNAVELRHLAHTRSGDKGNTSNITVIAWSGELYPLLEQQLTADAFRRHYAGVIQGPVTRYEIAHLGTLNFVAEGALGGGVSRSLSLDQYGKTLAAAILNFRIDVTDEHLNHLVNYPPANSKNHD